MGLFDGVSNKFAGPLGAATRDYFVPEFERTRRALGPIEQAFFGQVMNPGALFGAASTAAQGEAARLFAPGGEVSSMVRGARGRVAGQGFDIGSAEGAERDIMGAATQRVADTFATHAAGLEQARFGGLAGLYGDQTAGLRDLIQSLYTGIAGQQQLDMARQQMRQNRPRVLGIF